MTEGMCPDQKITEETLPSLKRCPARLATYPLSLPALRAADGIVSLTAILRPCTSRSRKRRRRGGNDLNPGVREKPIELILGWEMSSQFGIHHVAHDQTSGLKAVFERPLRDLAERCARNQQIE